MVGVPSPDGPDAGAARRGGRARSACSSRSGRSTRPARASRSGATASPTRSSTSAGPAPSTTRATSRATRTTARSTGASATSSRSTWPALTVDIKRGSDATASAGDRAARTGSARPDHQAPLFELGEWVADHGIDARRARTAPRATCCSVARRAPARTRATPLRRDGETGPRRPRGGWRSTLDRTDAADPGAARVRQDLQRRADDRDAARGRASGSASPATSHKVIGNLLKAVLKAADEPRASTSGRSSTASRDQVLDDERVARAKDAADVAGAARRRPGQPRRRARPGCGRRRRCVGAVDVLFVDEAGQISLANVVADRRGSTDSLVLLGDPQQLDQPMQGTHPPGADRLGAGPRPRRATPRCRPTAACSSRRRGGCIPDLCAFTSEVFYDDRLEPEPHLARPAPRCRRLRLVDGVGPAARRGARPIGRRQRVARRGRGGRRDARTRSSRAARRGSTRTAIAAPARLGRRPHRRAVQRPGRRDPAAAAARGPRRHRRQVPGPGGADQHLLADDVEPGARAARHGLPVQPATG